MPKITRQLSKKDKIFLKAISEARYQRISAKRQRAINKKRPFDLMKYNFIHTKLKFKKELELWAQCHTVHEVNRFFLLYNEHNLSHELDELHHINDLYSCVLRQGLNSDRSLLNADELNKMLVSILHEQIPLSDFSDSDMDE